MDERLAIIPTTNPSSLLMRSVDDFLKSFSPFEMTMGSKLILYFDEKSGAHYISCHLDAKTLTQYCDLEATIDADDEDELYRLNREITEDQAAYRAMERDAQDGRSFEDLVFEYDRSYRSKKPLKVYGGQHRLRAISKAEDNRDQVLHGVRIYFNLSRDQKVEIATVNNTSIAVPNDLLDRMREQLLGSELRDWCQKVGLLDKGEDFADRRSPDVPTVRIARTLLVNYFLGLQANSVNEFHQPIVCKSGGIDDNYLKIREQIDWSDTKMTEMGMQFSRLHKKQRETVLNRGNDNYTEYARKAISLAVVASWAYATGIFQKDPQNLQHHFSLPDSVNPPDDPLNAKALSLARLKLTDPDTYRGLGTRSSPRELGRMLEVFIVLATKASKKIITKELANAAIQSYEAKKAVYEANKVLKKI